MAHADPDLAATFRGLHRPGDPILLANAWDAGSARVIERCGARAIATTSAALAWSHGYPDGDALPDHVLAVAVAEIARVLTVPLSVDAEGGYSTDPAAIATTITTLLDAGAVGVNLEDGSGGSDLLAAKIEVARGVAVRAGVDLFINARTDVYLRGLVPPAEAVAETVARANRYRDAGCDGLFVPAAVDPDDIRAIVDGTDLPVNLLIVPGLPPVAELRRLGVARVSAGSGIGQAAIGLIEGAATEFFEDGTYETMLQRSTSYASVNALFE